jgi:hypothetical protein
LGIIEKEEVVVSWEHHLSIVMVHNELGIIEKEEVVVSWEHHLSIRMVHNELGIIEKEEVVVSWEHHLSIRMVGLTESRKTQIELAQPQTECFHTD